MYIQALVCASDVVIMTDNKGKLQRAFTEWACASRERGMEISASKTMNITKGIWGRLNFKWVHERKEKVEEIEYLGTTISANGKFDTEINNRVQKENQVYYYLNQTVVGKKEIHNNKNENL